MNLKITLKDPKYCDGCPMLEWDYTQFPEIVKVNIKCKMFGEIGIVEMTRQRRRVSLESVSYEICPYCKGRGNVKSNLTTSISVIRKLKRYYNGSEKNGVFVVVHPEVASCLLKEYKNLICAMENRWRSKIVIVADSNLHREEIKLKLLDKKG